MMTAAMVLFFCVWPGMQVERKFRPKLSTRKSFIVSSVEYSYDKETNTGGSNGATMRFDPESEHGANAGLRTARDFLEPIKGIYRAM